MTIFFKVKLTEENVRSYVQPEETYNTECNDTKNCIACAFRMLGLYDDKIANDITQICNRTKSAKEFPFYIDYQLNTIVKDVYELYFEKKLYFETLNFIKIANILPQVDLNPNEACLFCYFFQGAEIGHAVILRKNEQNELELIDPQFNASKLSTEYSLTEEQQREVRFEKTNNYSRVTGLDNIIKVLFNESQVKGFSKTFEDFNENTYIFFTFVDDLTMYVDKPEEKMEIDGGSLSIPLSPKSSQPGTPSYKSKEYEEEIPSTPTYPEISVEIGYSVFPKQKTSIAFEPPKVNEYIEKIHGLKYEELYNHIVSLLGTSEGDKDIITHLIEVIESEEEQDGGSAKMISSDEYKTEITKYNKELEKEEKDDVKKCFFLIQKALELYNVGRRRESSKGRKSGYEVPEPPGQCKNVLGQDYTSNKCWLCGGFAPYNQWDNNVGICDILSNQSECEHILPVNLMFFMKVLYLNELQKNVVENDSSLKKLQKMLYDNSCHLCNKSKDNGIYIQKTGNKFEPQVKSILIDVITFFLVFEKYGKDKTCDLNNKIKNSQELSKVRSLVFVGDKYYPNPIRGQLDTNFSKNPQTDQSKNASEAEKASNFTTLMSRIEQSHLEAYNKLVYEPNLKGLYNDYSGFRDAVEGTNIATTISNKKIFNKAETLSEELKQIAKMNKNVAVEWIVRRFCIIYDRMKTICDELNKNIENVWNKSKNELLDGKGKVIELIRTLGKENNGPASEDLKRKRARPSDEETSSPKRQRKGGQRVIEIDI